MGRASLRGAAIVAAALILGCAPILAPDAGEPATDSPVSLAGGRGIGPVAFETPAPSVAPRAELPSRAIGGAARVFPYVPQPDWRPTPINHDVGRDGEAVQYIVIHYTDISYERTLAEFNTDWSGRGVSAHYVVRGDGHIAQLVGESDTAWHAGNYWFNQRSVGIEIELDKITNPRFTAEQYYATAALACQISARHGIPLDRVHVVGHNEIPGTTHTDPGPTWSWPHFMWLTSLCAPPTAATVHASWVSQTPYPDITLGESATVAVVLRNIGATAWRKGTPQEARLGVRGNDTSLAFLGADWPLPSRVAVQSEAIVPPGETATFAFTVKGTKPGTFDIPLRGVVDGGAWMDDLGVYVTVVVEPAPRATSILIP